MSGNLVLGKYQSPWLVDHYFSEVGRVPHATLMRLHENDIISTPSGSSASVLQLFENDVIVVRIMGLLSVFAVTLCSV